MPELLLTAFRNENPIETSLAVVLLESTPVNVLEEDMRLDLLSTIDAKSFRWDSAEQSFEQVFEFRGHSSRNFQVSLLDVLVNVFQVFLKVGGHAHTELIQNGAETVPVHTFAVRKPLNDFRRQVGMCATERV